MNQPKPPPQTLQPDDERTVHIFLERASSIVLERPVLDRTHWRRLVALAEELGMSDGQLRATVNDLRQRGVISDIDLSPPKPPPLPNQPGETAVPSNQAGPEQDFSLTPPGPPPPPPNAAGQTPNASPDNSGQAPPKATQQSPATQSEQSHDERLQAYLERAKLIVAEQKGFGPRAQAMLAAAANELNLDDRDTADVLKALARRKSSPAPPPPPSTAKGEVPVEAANEQDNRRWRVEGAPPPEPPPPPKKPEEIYREYLSASMAQIAGGTIPTLQEKKFVRHATSVLGLAQTFAKHIVREEAAAKNLRIETQASDDADDPLQTANTSDDGELCDTNVKLFLERSVPILAQHRGINAKSRVLLNALATEFGLSEQQVDRAIAATQFRSTTSQEETDLQQQERLVGFRELVQGALISLPRKLLTFDVEENLARHGEERHGLRPDLVASSIREVCQALEIRQVSEQQARDHIEHLIDAKLTEHTRLPQEVRSRIEKEGKQWGFQPEQVNAIVKERQRLHDQRNRSEQNFTHFALLAASITMLMVASFFGWVVLQANRPQPVKVELPAKKRKLPTPIIIDESEVDTSWWGEELEFAVSSARREMRSMRPILIQVESTKPNRRQTAYERLTAELFDSSHDVPDLELVSRITSLCYARDPDPNAARQLLVGVLDHVPRAERDLRKDEELYPKAFLATNAAVQMIIQSEDDRQRDASTELGRAIGRTIDAGLAQQEIEEQAFEAVAERVYRLLIALAKHEPTLVASAYGLVSKETSEYVDATKLEKLNTDFLTTILSNSNEAAVAAQVWRDYQPLILSTVATGNAINVIRLLHVFETTEDPGLQSLLSEALIARIGKKPEATDVASIASAVRKSFGVTSEVAENERLTQFLLGANTLIGEPRARIHNPEAVLVEIVNFAYQCTLGCAVAEGEAGNATFDTLIEQNPEEFLVADKDDEVPKAKEVQSLDPTSERMLNDRLVLLSNMRSSPVTRFGIIESLVRLTERADDIRPDQAGALATYLLSKKRIEEHRAIIDHVTSLGKWKQVRLAVADQLGEVSKRNPQLEEIISKLLGRDYSFDDSATWRASLHSALLNDVLADAKRDDVTDEDKYQVFNDASETLYDFHVAQAVLLRVPEWPSEPATPTIVAHAIVDSQLKSLLASKTDKRVREQLRQLQGELLAIDYLATNDFQRMTLLDRIRLQLLAIDVAQSHPDRLPAADAIVNQLAVSDRVADHVLTQLRDGQQAILQMWLLKIQP